MPTARRPVYKEKDRVTLRALVTVPMTETEWREVQRFARRRKIALSRFVREAALREVRAEATAK